MIQFLEEAGGWQSAAFPVDYAEADFGSAHIQISFVSDTTMESLCPGADGCVRFVGWLTCPVGCSSQLYHDAQVQLYIRNSTWINQTEVRRRMLLNHEMGHTFGLAEHYINVVSRGHVADTSVYSGVMDNDTVDGSFPSGNELGAVYYIRTWY